MLAVPAGVNSVVFCAIVKQAAVGGVRRFRGATRTALAGAGVKAVEHGDEVVEGAASGAVGAREFEERGLVPAVSRLCPAVECLRNVVECGARAICVALNVNGRHGVCPFIRAGAAWASSGVSALRLRAAENPPRLVISSRAACTSTLRRVVRRM